MNQYGKDAKAYMQRWLPERYASLPDPVGYFTDLGEQVEQQVGDLWDQMILSSRGPEGETHEQRTARLEDLKRQAEQAVLDELVRLEPEPGTEGAEEDLLESDEEFAARIQARQQHTEWLSATCDALTDGSQRIEDLTDEQITQVVEYMTPAFLTYLGTSLEALRAAGRRV